MPVLVFGVLLPDTSTCNNSSHSPNGKTGHTRSDDYLQHILKTATFLHQHSAQNVKCCLFKCTSYLWGNKSIGKICYGNWYTSIEKNIYLAFACIRLAYLFPVLIDPYHRSLQGGQCFEKSSLYLTNRKATASYIVHAVEWILEARTTNRGAKIFWSLIKDYMHWAIRVGTPTIVWVLKYGIRKCAGPRHPLRAPESFLLSRPHSSRISRFMFLITSITIGSPAWGCGGLSWQSKRKPPPLTLKPSRAMSKSSPNRWRKSSKSSPSTCDSPIVYRTRISDTLQGNTLILIVLSHPENVSNVCTPFAQLTTGWPVSH